MDNSNPNQSAPQQPYPGQPMGPAPQQPYPNQAPYQGQPMPGPNPYQQAPYQGYGPMPQQGYSQPMPKPPKQPMDPAKKKKIILIVSICSGVAVLGIAAAIIIPILLRVDYSTAYNTAKDLKPKIYEISNSYDCGYVVKYYNSDYTSAQTFNGYISDCLDTFSSDTNDLVVELGETDGVKRNSDIKNQYDKFVAEYNTVFAGNSEDLEAKLNVYKVWHDFSVAVDDLTYSSADSGFNTAASYLANSSNETLKTYGETWLEKSLEVSAAYRAYNNASWSSSNYSELRNTYNNKLKELKDWVATNKPDIKALAPLNFDDTSKMNSEFTKLYNMIVKTYEENYNYGSGDCTEFMGTVSCS